MSPIGCPAQFCESEDGAAFWESIGRPVSKKEFLDFCFFFSILTKEEGRRRRILRRQNESSILP